MFLFDIQFNLISLFIAPMINFYLFDNIETSLT